MPPEGELEILRGLYLGDVAAADAKIGSIRESLRRAGWFRNVITVVTSDHGELFGEHDLIGHRFSLHNSLNHVPLVVSGLGDVEPRYDQRYVDE